MGIMNAQTLQISGTCGVMFIRMATDFLQGVLKLN